MHEIVDQTGEVWRATVVELPGPDYKGRFALQLKSSDGSDPVTLEDVAWNSRHTAGRTLDTMSQSELRRRLRIALGRRSGVRTP